MRTIDVQNLKDTPALYEELAEVLRDGGLVCFPTGRQYGVAAALQSEDAVIRLVQSKRRAAKAPSLVFVPDRACLSDVVDEVPPTAEALMDVFWPGPLTILFRPSPELPRKVTKTLAKRSKDKIGVRISHEEVASHLVKAFGGPLLISSANISRKTGSSSAASVRKNFGRQVDVMVEAGDVPHTAPSTVVDPLAASRPIVREGAIPADDVLALLTPADA